VYRLAGELKLPGWVSNSTRGVFVEVEGDPIALERFLARVQSEIPPRAYIQSLEHTLLDTAGFDRFEIRESDETGEKVATVLPDIATCPDCLAEIFDPENRRYRYPFTNCTNCGPRYSIIEALPYDRPNTTMRGFEMCPACMKEYEDPTDRRFHAQPNACPVCGPGIELWNGEGRGIASKDEAIAGTVEAIRRGNIVAVKGLGGFHLVVDAENDDAVRRLRKRKHRDEKPLALMYPTIEMICDHCMVTEPEKRLLESPETPVVLLERFPDAPVAESIAPGNPCIGAMLPYTPLHHILMRDLGTPVVATSGNLSEEPICIDEGEIIERLGGIADFFLVHNRPITRHVDDSVARIVAERDMVLRRARGYAPLPVVLPGKSLRTTLAVGGHLKNTVALSIGENVFVSQHVGDMSTQSAFGAFERITKDLQMLYGVTADRVVCDAHPDYKTARFAERLAEDLGIDRRAIQHHAAHVFSCMAENELEPPVLGVSWDGTGFGEDATVWGGEFLKITPDSVERVAHLRTFRLPGGETAVREPRRSALGLLHEVFGNEVFEMDNVPAIDAFSEEDRRVLSAMLDREINAPVTSSAGRLFDAVASIIGIRHQANFEGQAAMELEFALGGVRTKESYTFDMVEENGRTIIDWEPMIRSILDDLGRSVAPSVISAKFHNTLAEAIDWVAIESGEPRVVLTGGCFQNRYLIEESVLRLRTSGLKPYWHQRIPTNDGGIALGQIAAAAYFDNRSNKS
jgi:hydrogenase maturation protein HypF